MGIATRRMCCVLFAAIENNDCGADDVEQAIFGNSRTLFRVVRSMADQAVADRLKALAESYERRAEQASRSDAEQQSKLRKPVLAGFAER